MASSNSARREVKSPCCSTLRRVAIGSSRASNRALIMQRAPMVQAATRLMLRVEIIQADVDAAEKIAAHQFLRDGLQFIRENRPRGRCPSARRG